MIDELATALLSIAILSMFDRVPAVPSFWLSAVLFGTVGFLAARRGWWRGLPILALITMAFSSPWSEWSDPSLRPQIVRESGAGYPYHVIGSGVLAYGLTVLGMLRSRRDA